VNLYMFAVSASGQTHIYFEILLFCSLFREEAVAVVRRLTMNVAVWRRCQRSFARDTQRVGVLPASILDG
jgi:hypothetical protein